jgi:hypothetical protein
MYTTNLKEDFIEVLLPSLYKARIRTALRLAQTSADTRRNAWGMCVPEQQYHTIVGGFEEAQSELTKTQPRGAERENAHRYFTCFKLQCLETRSCVSLFT